MNNTLTIQPPDQVDLHEHGFVRLVDWCGDEIAICNAARVSFAKESSLVDEDDNGPDERLDSLSPIGPYPYTYLSKADKGLINFLLKNHHGTPFEQGFMAQFHLRVPIFVMREWVRHRVGFSINEESGRYTEMRGDFFIPEKARVQSGKPGHYIYEEVEDRGINEWLKGILKMHSERGYDHYKEALELGIAKEQARLFLGLNLYTEFRWTCNARSLMNFLTLRNDPPAMQEIREYAIEVEKIFAQHMPNVHQSFEENGRVAP